jgi:hypothetical protein
MKATAEFVCEVAAEDTSSFLWFVPSASGAEKRAAELQEAIGRLGHNIQCSSMTGSTDAAAKQYRLDHLGTTISVLVGTSTMSMGVSKKVKGVKITLPHNLGEYVQMAGRAGREEGLGRDPVVLEFTASEEIVMWVQVHRFQQEAEASVEAAKDVTQGDSAARIEAAVLLGRANTALALAKKAVLDFGDVVQFYRDIGSGCKWRFLVQRTYDRDVPDLAEYSCRGCTGCYYDIHAAGKAALTARLVDCTAFLASLKVLLLQASKDAGGSGDGGGWQPITRLTARLVTNSKPPPLRTGKAKAKQVVSESGAGPARAAVPPTSGKATASCMLADVTTMKVGALRHALQAEGLDTGGQKSVLQLRLKGHLLGQGVRSGSDSDDSADNAPLTERQHLLVQGIDSSSASDDSDDSTDNAPLAARGSSQLQDPKRRRIQRSRSGARGSEPTPAEDAAGPPFQIPHQMSERDAHNLIDALRRERVVHYKATLGPTQTEDGKKKVSKLEAAVEKAYTTSSYSRSSNGRGKHDLQKARQRLAEFKSKLSAKRILERDLLCRIDHGALQKLRSLKFYRSPADDWASSVWPQ